MESLVIDVVHIGAAVESSPKNASFTRIDIDEDTVEKIGKKNEGNQEKKFEKKRKSAPEIGPVFSKVFKTCVSGGLLRWGHMHSNYLNV